MFCVKQYETQKQYRPVASFDHHNMWLLFQAFLKTILFNVNPSLNNMNKNIC